MQTKSSFTTKPQYGRASILGKVYQLILSWSLPEDSISQLSTKSFDKESPMDPLDANLSDIDDQE